MFRKREHVNKKPSQDKEIRIVSEIEEDKIDTTNHKRNYKHEEEKIDDKHVFLAHNKESTWEVVKSMLEEICSKENCKNLDDAISYIESIAAVNSCMPRNQDTMVGLRKYIQSFDKKTESSFLELVRYIAGLALRAPTLFKKTGIRILRKNSPGLLYYTSEEIACVIAQGFFCCLPEPHYSMDLPGTINFSRWFCGREDVYQQKIEKMVWYFQEYQREEGEITEKPRRVSFERNYLSKSKYDSMNDSYFAKNSKRLSKVKIKSQGSVEDEENALVVDFANKYLGGGVMGRGYVQEEVLFVDYPELLM